MSRQSFVIAEAGVNHNGSLDLALKLVDVARDANADAVKFQTFKAESLVTVQAAKANYQVANEAKGSNQLEMLRELELGAKDFEKIARHCEGVGIEFMSTPFDEESANLLTNLGVTRFKIPSGEATNPLLIRHVSRLGKPVILSTGMCTLDEVSQAVNWVRGAGNPELWVLHCVSAYPAPFDEINLRAMATMEAALGVPVGFSDHTFGTEVSIAAAALGAVSIEKHFTLDRKMEGPDHKASLEPSELAQMIIDIRHVEAALGDGVKRRMPSETNTAEVARRSVVLSRAMPAGSVLAGSDLAVKRPGTGIPASEIDQVLGKRLSRDLEVDALLCWSDLS